MRHVSGKLGYPGRLSLVTTAPNSLPPSELEIAAQQLLNRLDVQEQTREIYRRHQKNFLSYCKQHLITRPTRDDILAYKKHIKSYSVHSQQNYLMSACRVWKFLNPGVPLDIRGIKIARGHRRDPLNVEQVQQLFKSVDTSTLLDLRDLAVLRLMYTLGLRTIEICRLNTENIASHPNGKDRIIWIWGKGRSSADSFCILPESCYTAIMAYLDARGPLHGSDPLFGSCSDGDGSNKTRRLSTRSIRRMFRSRLRAIGIRNPKTSAHSARVSAINFGLTVSSLIATRDMVRHQSIETTARYQTVIDRAVDAPEKKIDQLLNGGLQTETVQRNDGSEQ